MMGIPSLPEPPLPPPPFPGGRSVVINKSWDPMWRIPLITKLDADDPLPDWFATAFQERPGVAPIGTKAAKTSKPKAAGADKADLFAQIEAGRKLKKVPKPEQKPLQPQKPAAGARRASDIRRGSSANRRASEGTALSASEFFLDMMATGAPAGSAGARSALAYQLFTRFQYAPPTNNRYVQEARRRMQPERPTLMDALEVEVRTRFHALVVA